MSVVCEHFSSHILLLYRIVLYCIVLYFMLYCVVWYCIALYYIALCCVVLNRIALYCVLLCYVVLYCIILYCKARIFLVKDISFRVRSTFLPMDGKIYAFFFSGLIFSIHSFDSGDETVDGMDEKNPWIRALNGP